MQELVVNGSISFGLALVLMFLAMLLLVICSSFILLHSRKSQSGKPINRKFGHVRNCNLSPALVSSLHGMSSLGSLAHCNTYRSELSLRDRKPIGSHQMLTTMGSKINLNTHHHHNPASISNLIRGSAFTSSMTQDSSQSVIAVQRPPDVIEAQAHQSTHPSPSALPASSSSSLHSSVHNVHPSMYPSGNAATRAIASDSDHHSSTTAAYADSEAIYYYSSSDAIQSSRPPLPLRNCPTQSCSSSNRPPVAIESANGLAVQSNLHRSFAVTSNTRSELARAKPASVTDNEYAVADESASHHCTSALTQPPQMMLGRTTGRSEPVHCHNDSDNCSCSDYNAAYCTVGPEEHYIYQKVW